MLQPVSFTSRQHGFSKTLNQRVDEYFKTNNLTKKANAAMVLKTVAMLSIYFIPYIIIITGTVPSIIGVYYLLFGVMGIGMAGIGMSVMHDANHGAYSKKSWINTLVGHSLWLVGGTVLNWKIQHNMLHHTFTNIEGVDEDITPRGVFRFSPHTPWKPVHRYQYIYAWFFYGLLSLAWVVAKDIGRLQKYYRMGLVEKQNAVIWKEWVALILTKLFYFTYVLAVPILLSPPAVWPHIVAGFFLMHYIAGIILANVFQIAHATDCVDYPLPDKDGNINDSWTAHQLRTTVSFAKKNKILSWYVGGLNFQVEHHLFSNICHVHYKKLSPIIEKTAKEFGIPYYATDTYAEAWSGHYKLLKEMGKKDSLFGKPVLS